ncbi:MAG: hypothetical protein CfClM3_0444 [Methanobrevibacter sp. CfCl-M3]
MIRKKIIVTLLVFSVIALIGLSPVSAVNQLKVTNMCPNFNKDQVTLTVWSARAGPLTSTINYRLVGGDYGQYQERYEEPADSIDIIYYRQWKSYNLTDVIGNFGKQITIYFGEGVLTGNALGRDGTGVSFWTDRDFPDTNICLFPSSTANKECEMQLSRDGVALTGRINYLYNLNYNEADFDDR